MEFGIPTEEVLSEMRQAADMFFLVGTPRSKSRKPPPSVDDGALCKLHPAPLRSPRFSSYSTRRSSVTVWI
jgi:hypothetical protein